MSFSMQIFILIVLASLSLESISCTSYKKLSRNGYRNDQERAEKSKLVRLSLSKSEEPDSFEDLRRSHDTFRQDANSGTRKFSGLNSQLKATIGIGTPSQNFSLIFSTSEPNMWIPSLDCAGCGTKKRYNSSASTTYIEDGGRIHGGFDYYGFASIDRVSIGDVNIQHLMFSEILRESDDAANAGNWDGTFPLAYDIAAQGHGVTPLRRMVEEKLIDREMFAIYQNSTSAEIVFGGYDRSHIKSLMSWVPSYDVVTWAFRMDGITLKESKISPEVALCSCGCHVQITTDISYIIGPPEHVRTINEAMGAELDEDDDSLFVLPDCDLSKLSNLVFTINFDRYEFTPEQYINKVRKGDKVVCVSSLHAVVTLVPDRWFVGSSIIGHIYTVFDYDNREIGFAYNK